MELKSILIVAGGIALFDAYRLWRKKNWKIARLILDLIGGILLIWVGIALHASLP